MEHSDMASAAAAEPTGSPLASFSVRFPGQGGEQSEGSDGVVSPRKRDAATNSKPKLGRVSGCVLVQRWVPDVHTDQCMAAECQQPFSLFNRKHHCRVCGLIFCANCSANSMLGPVGVEANVRVCNSCFYEHQLAVARRKDNGEFRRRSRGELKMLQRSPLVHILEYLRLEDIFEVSLVSADFYFLSRDNGIWFLQNSALAAASDMQSFSRINHHSNYNFTQFLEYVQLIENKRCQGFLSIAACTKQLLSNKIKVGVIGPPNVGKTPMIRQFVGDIGNVLANHYTTTGFTAYTKRVELVGGLSGEASLTIYDVAGESCFEKLRGLCVQGCHVIVLCYNADSKMSLVEAANVMTPLEGVLGSQPVIVCGISQSNSNRKETSDVSAREVTPRCHTSLHTATSQGAFVFEVAVQAALDSIAASHVFAEDICRLSTQPSVIDVLLDNK